MIVFSKEGEEYLIRDADSKLPEPDILLIQFWGFEEVKPGVWVSDRSDAFENVCKFIRNLEEFDIDFVLKGVLISEYDNCARAEKELNDSFEVGKKIKSGNLSFPEVRKFLSYLESPAITRQLKSHQINAAVHLLCVKNAANFSVPGAGKTTVVLAVFSWLRSQGLIDSLFVVGPPSSFTPWKEEYKSVLGVYPSNDILAGGNKLLRKDKYYKSLESPIDLYLTTFQTLQQDEQHASFLFQKSGLKILLVVDEAHYIKQQGGKWAKSVLKISRFASRRCVLTGTPFPHSYRDAFNIFDTLSPHVDVINNDDKARLDLFLKNKKLEDAAALLNSNIEPLFYRVRKKDLHLDKQEFQEPTKIPMNKLEQEIYNTILDKIKYESNKEFMRDFETAQILRRGRMIRLRQAVSYCGMLNIALNDHRYNENLLKDNDSLAHKLKNYKELERPGKICKLIELITTLKSDNEKVVVWSNFIETLFFIKDECKKEDWQAEVICGKTPIEDTYNDEIMTRDKIIRQFKDPESGLDILIANPAACAESISLHQTCSNAIYYDLSYNCAQYLQSLDRIHRVGGSENKVSTYHFLQYEKTIESDIHSNIKGKAESMRAIIDQDSPIYSFEFEDGDLEAYKRLFEGNK